MAKRADNGELTADPVHREGAHMGDRSAAHGRL